MTARKVILPQFELTELADSGDRSAIKVEISGEAYYNRPKLVPDEGKRRDGKPRWALSRPKLALSKALTNPPRNLEPNKRTCRCYSMLVNASTRQRTQLMNEITQPLDDYFAALERLKSGKSLHVQKGSRITNDAVSLEAGRGKGSIKKSRAVFADLIRAIEDAAAEQTSPKSLERDKLLRAKDDAVELRRQLEAALAREVSLLKELYETRKQLAKLTGGRVVPIRARLSAEEVSNG